MTIKLFKKYEKEIQTSTSTGWENYFKLGFGGTKDGSTYIEISKMKKIFITMHTGYCGSTSHEVMEVPEDMTESDLEEMVWQMAIENAASYGYELCSDDCDDEGCECEHPGNTNIEGYWELYNAEKHEGRY